MGDGELGCCGLSALCKKVCRDGTTLSLQALMFLTQSSSIADKTGGCSPILTCPRDPSSEGAPPACVPHSKAPATLSR